MSDSSSLNKIKLIEDTLKEKEHRLILIGRLHSVFQSAHDLKTVFSQVYDIIQEYLGEASQNRVSLLLYDKEQDGLVSENHFGFSRFGEKGLAQPVGYSISGKCFAEGKTIIVDDCSNTDLIPKKYVDELSLKSALAVPVKIRGKTIGVLRLDNLAKCNAFTDSQLEFFSFITDQLGIVIENAKLIEQQKIALESIERIGNIYKNTISNAQGVAYSYSIKNKKYDFISDKCFNLFGIPANEFSRDKFRKMIVDAIVVDPKGPNEYTEYLKSFYKGERENYQVHLKIINAAGEPKWISDFSIPLRNPKTDELIGLQGIIQDISEQKRNEQMNLALLRISTAVYSAKSLEELFPMIHKALSLIMDVKNFYIAILDKEKKNITFPYAKDEIDPPPWDPIPFENSQSLTGEILKKPQVLLLLGEDLEERYQSGKSKIWGKQSRCWLGATLTVKGDVIGAIAVQSYDNPRCYRDEDKIILKNLAEQIAISLERKQSEENLHKMNEALKRINAEKDKFFSIIAHDFKSPISGFLGITELLANSIDSFSKEELSEISKSMNVSALNLLKLLENLLDWARMQRGKMDFIQTKLNLNQAIQTNIELINHNALQKNIKIFNNLSSSIDIFADEKMIHSIIRNLLSNAIKFTNIGGSVWIEAKKIENNSIQVSFEDNGTGMSLEYQNKLFKIEEKVGKKGTADESSTGLGLLLCKEFVEKNNGTIWVVSEENKGSKFFFTVKEASAL